MKILTLISGGDVGGAKTHVLSLLRELSRTETVTLVCFMEGEFTHDAREMGLDTRVYAGRNLPRVLDALCALVREGKYDLLHSHGSRGNFTAWLLKKRVGLPLLSTVHSDSRLDYMGRPLAGLVYSTLNSLALRHMDFLTGVSDAMTELLIFRGFPADRVFTIYNGVDFHEARHALPRAEFLKACGVPLEENAVYAGIAARLNPVKDIATLIRGFAAARQRQPQLRLLIAGDGPEEASLKALAASLGVTDSVYFLGWVSDTDSFYAALDINTLTSLSETFPYALTEGALWRTATVSSRVGGVPRLIDDGTGGFLFDPGDWATLADRLALLAGDTALREKLAEALYQKTRRLYSLEATVDTQKQIYETVLRRWRKKDGRRSAVAVCGSYGRGNAGDEAILKAILQELRETDPDIPIFVVSRRPKETRLVHRVRAIHTFNVFSFNRVAKKLRLYLNGGGSLIQDVTSRRSLWFYLYTLRAAKKRGARVVMYGCGIGPVHYRSDRALSARIISRYVDVITLREDHSLTELEALGVSGPDIRLAADPALTLGSAGRDQTDGLLRAAGLDPRGRYVCFVLRPWPGFEEKAAAFAQAADRLSRELGLTPVFLGIDQVKDAGAARSVLRLMETPGLLPERAYEAEALAGILSRMQAVISMRLHALIFAAGTGAPLVGVVYDPKVRAFLRYIGQSHDVDLDQVTAERLVALAQAAMRDASPAAQQAAVARLRSLDEVNRQVLREMLGTPGQGTRGD